LVVVVVVVILIILFCLMMLLVAEVRIIKKNGARGGLVVSAMPRPLYPL
jgi:hypothetical protein